MGYNILVTRRTLWSRPDHGKSISLEEWKNYINSHRDFTLDGSSALYKGSEDFWIQWCEGCLETKNPDEYMMRILQKLAVDLSAKVQGEEGEIYLSTGEIIPDEQLERVVYPTWLLYLCLVSFGCWMSVMIYILL